MTKNVLTPFRHRLFAKVLVGDGCWEWQASTSVGYGVIGRGRRGEGTVLAHRAMYEQIVGPIPEGLTLDHLCRNRRCVRPGHLEPVTLAENKRRGESIAEQNRRKTHCPQGHPYDDENTEWHQYRGAGKFGRHCKACRRERAAKRKGVAA